FHLDDHLDLDRGIAGKSRHADCRTRMLSDGLAEDFDHQISIAPPTMLNATLISRLLFSVLFDHLNSPRRDRPRARAAGRPRSARSGAALWRRAPPDRKPRHCAA